VLQRTRQKPRAAERDALLTAPSRRLQQSKTASPAPSLHHCAARDENLSPAACGSQAARAAGGGWCDARAKGCGVVACGGCCVAVCNITASYAKQVCRAKSRRPAGSHKRRLCLAPLRVNTATKSTSITCGEGQQNGAGDAPPLRLLLQGRCAVSFDAGAARYPHAPRSCAVALRATAPV